MLAPLNRQWKENWRNISLKRISCEKKKEEEEKEQNSATQFNFAQLNSRLITFVCLLICKDKYEDALRKYDNILRKHPTSPRAQLGRASTLDKMSAQKRSNDLLELSIKGYHNLLMDSSDAPPELIITAGRRLADRQQFRGLCWWRWCWCFCESVPLCCCAIIFSKYRRLATQHSC